MARLTGGQAVVKSLVAQGIDTVFGLPGMQLDHLFAAFHDERNAVRMVHTRHEQGAAYMAFGYAQSTGKVGVFAVVPGPGLLNAGAGLATAFACSQKVLCLTGQIPSPFIGRGIGYLHEIDNQLGILQSLTKWATRANHPVEIPPLMEEAFRQMQTGRPRPAAIEVPLDVLPKRAELAPAAPVAGRPGPVPDPDEVARAAELLGNARNPVIFAGGGAAEAGAELLELARLLEAPIVPSRGALGAVSDRLDWVLPMQGGHALWPDIDVALAVGTRFEPMVPGWGTDDKLAVIRLDIDPVEATRVQRPTVSLVADAREGLAALIAAVPARNRKRPSRKDERVALKAEMVRRFDDKVAPQMSYIRAMRDALPDDGFFVEELTQVGYVSRFMFPTYLPRHFIHTGYQGTLGYGSATALGVKVANPDKKVLAIAGDGGFMYNVPEMSTAMRHGIDITIVLFNDGHFGNVRRTQIEVLGGKEIAVDFRNPDFVKLAESFGWNARRATNAAEVGRAVAESFETAGPTLIEVPVGQFPSPWGFWHMPKVRPTAG